MSAAIPRFSRLALAAALLSCLEAASAGEARMKSGFVIQGVPVPQQALTKALEAQSAGPTTTYPIWMVDNGRQRVFIAQRQAAEVNEASDLSRYEKFKLPQRQTARKGIIAGVGGFQATAFDEFGRRRISLSTPRGSIEVVQGVTEINPNYVKLTALTHTWENAIATSSVPVAELDAMIRKVTNQKNPDDRLSIARFYLQAGQHLKAGDELDSIVRDFPELKNTVQESIVLLQQLKARELLGELRRRKASGQARLAYEAAKIFPVENMGADVLREVRELILAYEGDRERAARAINLMGDLQAKLGDPKRITAAGPIRTAITEGIDPHSLERLDAFLKLESDQTLMPQEKLALAFSGWVLGSSNAGTDFDTSVRLWTARHLVLEFLRTDDAAVRSRLLQEMRQLEGFSPKTLLQMIPLLPPAVETQGLAAGKPCEIEIAARAGAPSAGSYQVLLPDEYSPNRSYPLIIALHQLGSPPEQELAWWGTAGDDKPGQSRRHGYIVIAPAWADAKMKAYDYSADVHNRIQAALRDARQRFNIDSDRVFLSGHGGGGDAAFDVGMSHPDLFAGVIPIAGVSDKYCKWYWKNAKHTNWYVVTGELDRDTLARNSREMNRMLRYGYDLVYAEYSGRGYESYYEEIHRIFEWMDLHKRMPEAKELDVEVLRPGDTKFFWLEAHGLPPTVAQSAVLADDSTGKTPPVRPMSLIGKATEGNAIYITSGSPKHTLWLTPGVVDFEKRVLVRQGNKQKFNDFVEPSLPVILDDLRQRGDHQRVLQAQIEID